MYIRLILEKELCGLWKIWVHSGFDRVRADSCRVGPNFKGLITALGWATITYHDIIAFHQELGVKGARNLKGLSDFPSGILHLMRRRKTHT